MKEILLANGRGVALVDDEDYDWLMQWKWHLDNHGYAKRTRWSKQDDKKTCVGIRMHRVILGITNSQVKVDHINSNRLDNQRKNLRIATNSQNAMNRRPKNGSSSQFKGVGWHKAAQKWCAYIAHNRRSIYLGVFNSEMEAARARDKAAKLYHGDFAKLNFPEEGEVAA